MINGYMYIQGFLCPWVTRESRRRGTVFALKLGCEVLPASVPLISAIKQH